MTKEDFEKARYLLEMIEVLKRQKNNVSYSDCSLESILKETAFGFDIDEETLDQDYGSIINDLLTRLNVSFDMAIEQCEKKLEEL